MGFEDGVLDDGVTGEDEARDQPMCVRTPRSYVSTHEMTGHLVSVVSPLAVDHDEPSGREECLGR